MTEYESSERGHFQTEYANQLVSFDGMRFKGRTGKENVTPTDIDGCIQLDNENCVIFFELKYSGNVPTGQYDALKKLSDCCQAGGTNSVVFTAIHGTKFPKTIIAKDAIVTNIYWNGREWPPRTEGIKLYDAILNYLNYIKEEKNGTTDIRQDKA